MRPSPPSSSIRRRPLPSSSSSSSPPSLLTTFTTLLLLLLLPSTLVLAGWGDSSSTYRYDGDYLYTASGANQWLYSSSSIAITVQGCVWGFVDDNEESGCMEDSSEDGTYYWYQMSNCRRAQVAYTVFASDSGSATCSSSTFVNSFVTKNGFAEFIDIVQEYADDDIFSDDDMDNIPEGCEEDGNGYYLALGCSSSGGFTVDKFSDAYCQKYSGTYKSLSSLDTSLSYMSCRDCYNAANGDDYDENMCTEIIAYSEACSPTDYDLCLDVDGSKTSSLKKAGRSSGGGSNHAVAPPMTVASKIKYTLGSAFLLSSFVMFLGILSTNRRKRRALIQRKFRQSARGYDEENGSGRGGKNSKSRSRSRGRGGKSSASKSGRSSSRRSKSRSRKDREGGTFA